MFICDISGKYIGHMLDISRKSEIYLRHIWGICGMYLGHMWDMSGTCLGHVFVLDLSVTCLRSLLDKLGGVGEGWGGGGVGGKEFCPFGCGGPIQ